MARSVSITVHPSELGAEYLTVSDAMRQVLDLIEALERSEDGSAESRQIVWRLTEAHTSSPPFTVTAQAFPRDPEVLIALQADQVTARFSRGVTDLLAGRSSDWVDSDVAAPLKRVLARNLNGVGRTEISIDGEAPVDVVPSNARVAVVAIERLERGNEIESPDYRRTEFGAVEVEVCGLGRWFDRPALIVVDRLSREKVTCVLTPELATELGPAHKWAEAWADERLLVTGALHYGSDGSLKRVDAEGVEPLPWTDVSLTDLKDVDVLQGRTVSEHLALIRAADRG
jgi:hypothetical protein